MVITQNLRAPERPACPLCSHSAAEHLVLPHASVMVCLNSECRLRFAFPQLDSQALAVAYQNLYYPAPHTSAAVYENTPAEILRQTFARAESKLGPLAGKHLLDFGCGVGGLCQIASEYGLRVAGIEPNTNARETAIKNCGLRIYANLRALREAQPEAQFDLVTMWDVIEHLRDPLRELRELCGLLQPGGWLLLSTPNAGSLRALLLRGRWENAVNRTHFYYFTRRSLHLMLKRAGFSKITELLLAIRYPRHAAIRRAVHRILVICRLHGQLVVLARP
jgi:SAM-dependent methyltransferase